MSPSWLSSSPSPWDVNPERNNSDRRVCSPCLEVPGALLVRWELSVAGNEDPAGRLLCDDELAFPAPGREFDRSELRSCPPVAAKVFRRRPEADDWTLFSRVELLSLPPSGSLFSGGCWGLSGSPSFFWAIVWE